MGSLWDVSLVGGGGYFVEPEPYAKHLLGSVSQDEVWTGVSWSLSMLLSEE